MKWRDNIMYGVITLDKISIYKTRAFILINFVDLTTPDKLRTNKEILLRGFDGL